MRALVASIGLGWLDSVVSLEDLARKAGVGRSNLDALALQYRDDWLSSIKTKIRLGIIPSRTAAAQASLHAPALGQQAPGDVHADEAGGAGEQNGGSMEGDSS